MSHVRTFTVSAHMIRVQAVSAPRDKEPLLGFGFPGQLNYDRGATGAGLCRFDFCYFGSHDAQHPEKS